MSSKYWPGKKMRKGIKRDKEAFMLHVNINTTVFVSRNYYHKH